MDTSNTCRTCKTHRDNLKAFLALPLPANGKGETVNGGLRMAARNCECGSTLLWVLEDLEAE